MRRGGLGYRTAPRIGSTRSARSAREQGWARNAHARRGGWHWLALLALSVRAQGFPGEEARGPLGPLGPLGWPSWPPRPPQSLVFLAPSGRLRVSVRGPRFAA